jgi:hypothetical protein
MGILILGNNCCIVECFLDTNATVHRGQSGLLSQTEHPLILPKIEEILSSYSA